MWHHQSWPWTLGCNLLFLCPQTGHYPSNMTCFYLLDGKDEDCFLKIVGIYSWIYFVSHKVPQSFTCCSLQASLFPFPFVSPPPFEILIHFSGTLFKHHNLLKALWDCPGLVMGPFSVIFLQNKRQAWQWILESVKLGFTIPLCHFLHVWPWPS